jgi:UDP:flavonoid glycosyltransferase YjiC (YdhE family)
MIDALLTSKTPFVFAQASPFAAVHLEYTAAIEASDISLVAPWVPQEALLAHRAIVWFVTHGGWNSTQEGILVKVPQ